MAIRAFTDSAGIDWRVWKTVPDVRATISSRFAAGWLTFDSAKARRRLAPVPDGWKSAPDGQLERLCRIAEPVARTTFFGSG